ncbi:MAG: glycosyltransferase family 2 protein, partial [Bacteroidia bacterium]
GTWGGINPHDKYELHEPDATIKKLPGDILHYSYYSVAEHYKQADKFSTIAAKALHQQGKKVGPITPVLKAAAKFMRNYFLKAGFLDGRYGWTICRITAFETWQKYSKLRQLNQA